MGGAKVPPMAVRRQAPGMACDVMWYPSREQGRHSAPQGRPPPHRRVHRDRARPEGDRQGDEPPPCQLPPVPLRGRALGGGTPMSNGILMGRRAIQEAKALRIWTDDGKMGRLGDAGDMPSSWIYRLMG